MVSLLVPTSRPRSAPVSPFFCRALRMIAPGVLPAFGIARADLPGWAWSHLVRFPSDRSEVARPSRSPELGGESSSPFGRRGPKLGSAAVPVGIAVALLGIAGNV